MKPIILFTLATGLLVSCSPEKLERATAMKILRDAGGYPKVVDVEIYTGDPEDARKVLDAGLENKGLLKVQRTQKLGDASKPIISFTKRARPYLLAGSDADKKSNIQKVRIAEEVLLDITGVQMQGDDRAVVEYRTGFRNQTPFSKLSSIKLFTENTRISNFARYDDGWRLEE